MLAMPSGHTAYVASSSAQSRFRELKCASLRACGDARRQERGNVKPARPKRRQSAISMPPLCEPEYPPIASARANKTLVRRCSPPARMPTKHGHFVAHTYRSCVDGIEHIALVKGGAPTAANHPLCPFKGSNAPALVRVHSECCTGDIFDSLRCDCGEQLRNAMRDIETDGHGVVLYLRGQEGRGIGLGAKMHAYALQERGFDTLDANVALGLPVDSREYGTGAQILTDLGIRNIRLISNNPQKFTELTFHGLFIVDRVPSNSTTTPENAAYMETKRQRMGHLD